MSNKIDGLTLNQWKKVVNKQLIVECWGDWYSIKNAFTCKLVGFSSKDPCSFIVGVELIGWKHCRIHPSQPQFNNGKKPDWLSDDDMVCARDSDKGFTTARAKSLNFAAKDAAGNLRMVRWQKVAV